MTVAGELGDDRGARAGGDGEILEIIAEGDEGGRRGCGGFDHGDLSTRGT